MDEPVEAIEMAPVPLKISGGRRPSVLLNGVEVVQAVRSVELVLDERGGRCLLDLLVEVDWDFPVVVAVPDGLQDLTAQELDQVIAGRGYSESPGAAVLGHLRDRLGPGR